MLPLNEESAIRHHAADVAEQTVLDNKIASALLAGDIVHKIEMGNELRDLRNDIDNLVLSMCYEHGGEFVIHDRNKMAVGRGDRVGVVKDERNRCTRYTLVKG